jgi:hypothetical protein
VRRAKKPRIHRGVVTFGPHLKWPLPVLERTNGTEVVYHRQDGELNEVFRGTSTVIRYDDATCGKESIVSMSNCILTNFFYVELIDRSHLKGTPEVCLLKLRCRVQQRPALSNILLKFRESRIYFRGDEPNDHVSHLLPLGAVNYLNQDDAFFRIIEVMVSSP